MEKVKRSWRHFQDFDNDSDYFWLVDSVCLMFEQRPPLSKRTIVRIILTALSVIHGFQYMGFTVQMVRSLLRSPWDIVELTTIVSMEILLGIGVLRGICLAFHRDDVMKLKQFVNSKLCQHDNAEAFEQRKNVYRKINRYVAAFHFVQMMNSCIYSMSAGRHEDVFKYPFATDRWPKVLRNLMNICTAFLCIPWGVSVWYSATQFLSLLSVLHTELRIIVDQFKYLFEDVVVDYALELNDLKTLPRKQQVRCLADLDTKFKDAISHHSEFISKYQLLKIIASFNFFIFFCASVMVITMNVILFVLNPSIESLPLQLLAIQFITEIYVSCYMFNSLENENNRITNYVYGIDWINTIDRPFSPDVQVHCQSIIQNSIILQTQVKNGLTIRAGGVFPLNRETFAELMKGIYSLVSLLLRVITDEQTFLGLLPAFVNFRYTSATELISRRGVFSRRHYGSVDQLPQSEIDGLDPNCRRFRLENGESLAEKDEVFGSPSTPILENPEHQTRWYFKYFLGKLHQNYVGIDSEKNPYFLSIVSQDSGSKCMPLYRVMVFRKQGAQKLALPYNPQQKLTVKQILSNFSLMDANKSPKEVFSADIQKDLLLLEEQEGSVNFKFGVVYMKAGQKMDDEMLSNEYGSADFDEFLALLGEKVRLKEWERYRGGLDVKGDMTGKYSIYTLYEGHEIMFHVSTLLPFSRDNRQQVERKRHIGNDIVNIIFVDEGPNGEEPEFNPNNIKSQFTHVFAVVTKRSRRYRLSVYCDETVPPFGPTLPNPPEFEDPAVFRDFLLVKLINGEKATFQTPTFARKRERTLEMLIKDLYEEYVHDNKMNDQMTTDIYNIKWHLLPKSHQQLVAFMLHRAQNARDLCVGDFAQLNMTTYVQNMLNRRAFSEVLYDAPRTSKLKEDARQVEFVRIGQALKLEAIVRGDAPTSIASAGSVFKRPPWEPQCFYPTFQPRNDLVGDSWGQDQLFLASDEGTYLIKEDQTHRVVFDRTLSVRQLSVIEDHGIMLVRGGSAMQKDGHRVHVFRLNEFTEDRLGQRSRIDVKDRRIEKTRGCHLFAISRAGEAHLRMAVAVGRKLFIFQWKHTAAWTSWCPNSDNDTVDGFIFLKEITLHDAPMIMTILEGSCPNSGLLICVGYKNSFEIVSEATGHATKLHEADTRKQTAVHLVAALDLYDGQDTELLLCYNHTCHFQKLSEECSSSSEFDFQFNTPPTSVVCAFPYIIAFTPDSMEIRLLVNGNLVHTVMMAQLQLITSKKDIYFVTTAPEFIPKGAKLRGPDSEDHEIIKPRIEESRVMPDDDGSTSPGRSRLSSDEDNNGAQSTEGQDSGSADTKTSGLVTPLIQRASSLQTSKPDAEKTKETTLSADDIKRSMSKSNSYGEAGSSFSIPTTTCSKDLAKHFGAQPQPNTKNLCKHFGEPSVPPNSPQNNTIIKGSSPSSPTRKSFIRQPTLNLNKSQLNEGETSPSNGSTIKPLRIYRIPLTNLTGTHIQSHHYHYPSTDPSKKPTAVATKMHPIKSNEPSNTLSSSHEEEEEAEGPGRGSSSEDDGNPKMSIFDRIQQDLQDLSMKDKTELEQQDADLRNSILTPL